MLLLSDNKRKANLTVFKLLASVPLSSWDLKLARNKYNSSSL